MEVRSPHHHRQLRGQRDKHMWNGCTLAAWLLGVVVLLSAAHASAQALHVHAAGAAHEGAGSEWRWSGGQPHTGTVPWSFFGIQSYVFVGRWGNATFAASAWLRVVCRADGDRDMRALVTLNAAPFAHVSPEGVHTLTPVELLGDEGTLPVLYFTSADGSGRTIEAAQLINYDGLVRGHEDGHAMLLGAVLPQSALQLRMEGSERVHALPRGCGPASHPLFADGTAWTGVIDATPVQPSPGTRLDAAHAAALRAVRPPPPAKPPANGALDVAGDGTTTLRMPDIDGLIRLLGDAPARAQLVATLSAYSTEEDAAADASIGAADDGTDAESQLEAADLLSAFMATLKNTEVMTALKNAEGGIGAGAPGGAAAVLPSSVAGRRMLSRNVRQGDSSSNGNSNNDGVYTPFVPGSIRRPPAAASAHLGRAPAPAAQSDVVAAQPAPRRLDPSRRGDALRLLLAAHLGHHRALGFAGALVVVTRHTADMLLESPTLRRAVRARRLVLVLWESGLEPRASHFMQVPAYNLLSLAAWGSGARLLMTDLDEFLVLPQHRSIGDELRPGGCLAQALAESLEAIIPNMWVAATPGGAPPAGVGQEEAPELEAWLKLGSLRGALAQLRYAMWPYTYCDGACKALIDPNAALLFQVHQFARPPPRPAVSPVNWRCAYMLHFFRLWSARTPSLMESMGYAGGPSFVAGMPLMLEDVLPPHALAAMRHRAELYAQLLATQPTLGGVAIGNASAHVHSRSAPPTT